MKKAEARAAAEMLRELITRCERGELSASPRVVARLQGAAMAFEAAAQRAKPQRRQTRRS